MGVFIKSLGALKPFVLSFASAQGHA